MGKKGGKKGKMDPAERAREEALEMERQEARELGVSCHSHTSATPILREKRLLVSHRHLQHTTIPTEKSGSPPVGVRRRGAAVQHISAGARKGELLLAPREEDACGEAVRTQKSGAAAPGSGGGMSLTFRCLFLRNLPIFGPRMPCSLTRNAPTRIHSGIKSS